MLYIHTYVSSGKIRRLSNPSIFRKISVFESEVAFLPLTPRTFPVEVDVYSLFVLLCYGLRLGVTLEPCQVLDVEAPRLPLQFFRCEILLICSRKEVEHVEQGLNIKLREDTSCAQHWVLRLRIVLRSLERIAGDVVFGLFRVLRLRYT